MSVGTSLSVLQYHRHTWPVIAPHIFTYAWATSEMPFPLVEFPIQIRLIRILTELTEL